MSLRPLLFAVVSLAALAWSPPGHSDRLQLAVGVEGGDRIETDWFGTVAELDARLTHYLSVRITGRAQHFVQDVNTCAFQAHGAALDATGGLRLDLVPADRPADARPFVVGAVGFAGDRTRGTCADSSVAWMTSPMLQLAVGVDLRSELPPGFSFRLEARAAFADFAPGAELEAQFNPTWEHQQLDNEYGIAALLVVQL
jgi:hypothetical protein